MNKKIRWILVLMFVGMSLLICLQLYWNYQNYLVTLRNFKTDTNAALRSAVDREKDSRYAELENKMRKLISDTSIITIASYVNPLYKTTVFKISDTHPPYSDRLPFYIGFTEFKEIVPKITPSARDFFIKRYTTGRLRSEIRSGSIYFTTQRLGDSLEVAFTENKFNWKRFEAFFNQELNKRGVFAAYRLNEKGYANEYPYATLTYSTSIYRKSEFVKAYFPDPKLFFIQQMKWVIFSSFLLCGVILFCFYFTIKTILGQHRLQELKDDFINNMTHEIKTPLASLAITAQALQLFDTDAVKRKEYLHIIGHQIRRLNEITEVLLDSAQHETQNNSSNQVLLLTEIVNEAIANMDAQIVESEALIKFHPATESLKIMGDRFSMVHALMNLIDNAIKYNLNVPKVEITIRLNHEFAELAISDNGIGIDPSYKNQVFEKFFRVPTGDLHNVKGTGLGLSYVKAVITRQKGKINLIPSPEGTTFIIVLPVLS